MSGSERGLSIGVNKAVGHTQDISAGISRAGITAPDFRTGLTPPVIPAPQTGPERKPHGRRLNKVAAVVLSVATLAGGASAADKVITGQFPWDQLSGAGVGITNPTPEPINSVNPTVVIPPSGSPETTPANPSFSQEPSPSFNPSQSPTETPTEAPTPTPTVEVTPTPTPEVTPEPTPNIENVPLVKGGVISRTGAILEVYGGTITAIEKNPNGTVKDFAVTIAGNKITRKCAEDVKINLDFCSYGGVTFWVSVPKNAYLLNANDMPNWGILGKGPDAISKYIKLGKAIPDIMIPLQQVADSGNVGFEKNVATLTKLNGDIGDSFPRAKKIFPVNPSGIFVEP